MAISRASVLTGHVLGNVIQTMISLVLVIGVALARGVGLGALGYLWARSAFAKQ
ncbi:hypothetical protein [Streptomyces sp. HUAS TT7]|uniref:hypothetical protein n=1 Tax=Streptomyces sp. HUAS TT7 TaxID=3447507 RepID=UPI003F6554C6